LTAAVEALLLAWRDWPLPLTAPPTVEAPMAGGLTNRSYRLHAPGLGQDLVIRLHYPSPHRLGIDRGRERTITQATAAAGIGRPACWWTDHYSLFPFIDARPWTRADFASPAQRARLRPLLERLADLSIDEPRRRYREYLLHYWQQLAARSAIDARLQREWTAFWPDLCAFDQAGWPAGLVHHDLVPANVLDRGDELILIDWEYAAMGHPGIDRWSVDPSAIDEPFIAELMAWINRLWERLLRL